MHACMGPREWGAPSLSTEQQQLVDRRARYNERLQNERIIARLKVKQAEISHQLASLRSARSQPQQTEKETEEKR